MNPKCEYCNEEVFLGLGSDGWVQVLSKKIKEPLETETYCSYMCFAKDYGFWEGL
jgi:hypothetical protein